MPWISAYVFAANIVKCQRSNKRKTKFLSVVSRCSSGLNFPCPKRLVIRSKTFRRFMSNDEAFFFVSFPAVFYDEIYMKECIKKVQKVQGSLYILFSPWYFLYFLF